MYQTDLALAPRAAVASPLSPRRCRLAANNAPPHALLPRLGSSSETESEAGDLLEQQFEELNNRLTSATDPTGYLRMVSRNNLFNRSHI